MLKKLARDAGMTAIKSFITALIIALIMILVVEADKGSKAALTALTLVFIYCLSFIGHWINFMLENKK